ncbi:hypothetical protein FB451DRAFT_1566634 [Mycena latifolia]|nr:hypothetical protein FB451DRAFT_1566634 [Mycena latifolia]
MQMAAAHATAGAGSAGAVDPGMGATGKGHQGEAEYASLVIALVGALTHSFPTLQLAASWRVRALDAENAAAVVSFMEFFGVLQPRTSGCTAADRAFTAFLTVLAAYAASRARSSRSSRHPPPLPLRRLHALRAPRRHHHREWGRPRLLPLPPNVHADVVYVPVHAPAGSAEVWVHAPLEADAGLLDARVTCARAAVALLAGMLVLPVIRLPFLLAVSTHCAHLVAPAPGAATAGSATAAAPAERARGGRGVRARACARGQPAEVWVEADAGLLDARVVHRKRK